MMRLCTLAVLCLATLLSDAERIHQHSDGDPVALVQVVADVPAPAPTGDTTTATLEAVLYTLRKLLHAGNAFVKFTNMKTALSQTREALGEAEEAAMELQDKIPRAVRLLAESGLQSFLHEIEDGSNVRLEDFQLDVDDDERERKASEMKVAVQECAEVAQKLKTVMMTIDGVAEVLENTKALFNALHELAESVLGDVDIAFIVDPVKASVVKAKRAIEIVYNKILLFAENVMPMVDEFFSSTAHTASVKAHAIYAKYPGVFDQVTQMLPELEFLYGTVIKPLVPQLKKAVDMVGQKAGLLWPNIDRPEHVATQEISRDDCTWRGVHRYRDPSIVDVGETMVCTAEKQWHGRYTCWCAGSEDCYVGKSKRPEPIDFRRCFKPV